ncbi:hypothetical protein GGQ87_002408 [Brevundimonas alba]|uniref:Uncharacterized protein n=2 Tax=Brevundimonas alba TaxID=74314 RepID=A0A7X6BNF3_9CAUL|nr:hypothetical protein [Brevundimonas alba]
MVDSSLQHAELAAALIAVSDQRCEDYLVGVTVQRNSGSSTLSVVADALGTVGGLASEAAAANAFAASSLFVNNTSKTLNANVFGGRDFAIIYDAVKRGRDAERRVLLDRGMNGDFDALGRNQVLAEIYPYDLDCGISYGLSRISAAVAAS